MCKQREYEQMRMESTALEKKIVRHQQCIPTTKPKCEEMKICIDWVGLGILAEWASACIFIYSNGSIFIPKNILSSMLSA